MVAAAPHAGVTQLVECDLAKVDVAGSNPVSRSKFPSYRPLFFKTLFRFLRIIEGKSQSEGKNQN